MTLSTALRSTGFLSAACAVLLFATAAADTLSDVVVPCATLKAIEIEGLRRTRREVVEREISVRPGEIVDSLRLKRDRLTLLDLDIFAEVVFTLSEDDTTGQLILTVAVSERPTILAYPIVNYDPDDGVTYGAYVAGMNLRGLNQRAGISAEDGGRRGASAWFSTPWTAGRRVATAVSAYTLRRRLKTESLIETREGVAASLEPLRRRETGLPVSIGWERVRTREEKGTGLEGADGLPALPGIEQEEDHRWAGVGYAHDTRDYRVRPLRGGRVGAGMTQHGGLLGGDTSMQRYTLDALWVVPTGRESAVTAGMRAAWSRGTVPRYLRMTLGGANTLRGHAQGEYGGASRWVGWLEHRSPLLPKMTREVWRGRYTVDITVDWTAFVDVGSIWDGDALQDGNAVARFGGGAGLRIVAPLVRVIRLDVATDGRRVRAYALSGVRL